ncbi:MAG: hypothetical protein L0Y71_11045 [Gemmataceae bacterium]|nr:hypothetical protein [Gemmataceae bacterium]
MPTERNGDAEAELNQLFADLHRRFQELVAEKNQLEHECVQLRQTVSQLQEKCANYSALVRHYGALVHTPEDVERVMRHNQWVEFQEIEKVLAEVQDAAHG